MRTRSRVEHEGTGFRVRKGKIFRMSASGIEAEALEAAGLSE